jgi:hypothetical protein
MIVYNATVVLRMIRNCIVALLLVASVNFCFQQVNGQIPRAKKLSGFHQTDFVPTLEHKISKNRNAVYCASFLYAWDKVRNIIKTPLFVDSSLYDLYLVNNSRSYINTLQSHEYVSKGEIKGNVIKLNSEFTKPLPFERPLIGDGQLVFGTKRVPSFGSYGEESKIIEIVYYKNDNEYVIKLSPKDKEHEIILCMTQITFSTMAELIAEITSKRKIGLTERVDELMSWKYSLTGYDIVDIPKLGFDITTNYQTIEGNRVKSNAQNYQIGLAKQRIGFYLNEKGAEVNTETLLEVVFGEPMQGGKPKTMKFDKPFFLMLKRIDNNDPYFALWIANTELMKP